MITQPPKQISAATLEVVVMPNGEVICDGKSIGYVKTLGKYLTLLESTHK
jgi:hypothetical protein